MTEVNANEMTAPGHVWGTVHGVLRFQSCKRCAARASWQTATRSWTSPFCVTTLRGASSSASSTRGVNTTARRGEILWIADANMIGKINLSKNARENIRKGGGESGGNPGNPTPLPRVWQARAPRSYQCRRSKSSQLWMVPRLTEMKMKVAMPQRLQSLIAMVHMPASSDYAVHFTKWRKMTSCLRHPRMTKTRGQLLKGSASTLGGQRTSCSTT